MAMDKRKDGESIKEDGTNEPDGRDSPPADVHSPSPITHPGDEFPDHPARLKEVALLFLRLGFTAFGGPAAHVAMMEDEVVVRRNWLDRGHFLDLLASVNFVPGPNSTELAIHLGLIRAGFAGLLVAGTCFIVPAVLIILPLAFVYVRSGSVPQIQAALLGINACVVAIIASAAVRFAKTAVNDRFTLVIAILATIAGFATDRFPQFNPELLILAGAALLGAIYYGKPKWQSGAMLSLIIPLAISPEFSRDLGRMLLVFLKIGATLFGSGYVLVSYLQVGLVDHLHWLTKKELLDAIAIGQVTPGPLLTTATFIGYVLGAQKFHGGVAGGIIGGLLATIGIFAPAFVCIALLGRLLPRIRANRYAAGALKSMNAAVVALIVVVCWRLAISALAPQATPSLFGIAIAIATLILILVWKVNTTWLIVGAAVLGVIRLLA
jgi:chromate transporter